MGRGLKGSVNITKDGNRIRLRWGYNSQRYSLNLLAYNKTNLHLAKKISVQIEQDIALGQFDNTLNKYRDNQQQKQACDLVTYFEHWVSNYKNMDCEKHCNYYSLRAMLKKWNDPAPKEILAKFNAETFGISTYNRRLTMLKDFAAWMVKQGNWHLNPFEDVKRKKCKKVSLAQRKPFNEGEIKQILDAIKNDTYCPKSSGYKHSFYYPFLYLLFKTGVRPAEAIGLRVNNVDIVSKHIHIKEVMARTLHNTNSNQRIRKETKNGKERVLPLTDDLLEIIAPLLTNKKGDDLVFQSCTGKAIDDRMFQRRVFKPVLKALNIPERVLYAARHTFGSRCLDMGMPPVQVSFMMGNNPETLLRTYTHQITLPTHLPEI